MSTLGSLNLASTYSLLTRRGITRHVILRNQVVPGKGGIFDVHVDGELVFTKSMLGRYPQPDDVVPLLRERLGAG